MATADDFEFTVDRDWRITSISESAAAWAGSRVADLIGRDGREINPAATRRLAGGIEAAFAQNALFTLEQPSTHVPGRWVKIEIASSQDGARVRFEDITARVARLLPDDVDKYRLGAGAAEIALLDRRGVIVAVNAAWRAAALEYGLELADLGIGALYADVSKALLPELDEVAFQKRLDELLLGRIQQFEATYELQTAHGQELRQVQIAPLRIGQTTYFAAINEDLTDRAKVLAAGQDTPDELLDAQEKERQRIAAELRGSTSQRLASLTSDLENLGQRIGQDHPERGHIEAMVKLARIAAQETEVLAFLMNASGREREGLGTSARRLAEGFGRRAGLAVTFETEGPVDAVSAAVQHAVFRVIQEAVSNVCRHARAKRVSVRLASEAGMLTVRVCDDGQGLPPGSDSSEPPLGVGILGMRVRMEQLGGRLEVEGGPSGTSVTATVPCGRARPVQVGNTSPTDVVA